MDNTSNTNAGRAKKKSRKKLLIVLGVVVVLAIIIIANLASSSEKGHAITAGEVEKGDVISEVTATGRVQPKTEVSIQASVQATIVELPVDEGDTVLAGDLLVRLDQTRYEAAVRMANASLASARATMKQNEASMLEARMARDRAVRLFQKGLMSEEQKITAETAYEVAKARYESAEYRIEELRASLTQANDQLDKTILRAPIDGVITELNAEVGEIVLVGTMNNPGTVIMTVSDLSEIEVEAEVDETDIASVRLGQKAAINVDAFPDTVFKGIVTKVGNSARVSGFSSQDQITNFIVNVQFVETYSHVKPGMTAEVDITTAEHFDVLKVPIQAVVIRDELPEEKKSEPEKESSGAIAAQADSEADADLQEWLAEAKEYQGVYVIRDGRAKFVKVTTGIADRQDIEITFGLQGGEEIVIGPYRMLRRLKHDDMVKIERRDENNNAEDEE